MQQSHFYRIWLRSFASSIFLVINTCRPCWMMGTNFSKSGYFSTCVISETKSLTPIFFAFLTQVSHYLTAVKKILKMCIDWKFLREGLQVRNLGHTITYFDHGSHFSVLPRNTHFSFFVKNCSGKGNEWEVYSWRSTAEGSQRKKGSRSRMDS